MITKKQHGLPDRDMDRQIHRHIISTGPHWGPPDPSVGINTNTKIAEGLQKKRTYVKTDRHIIFPLRCFDLVACSHMRCMQLWGALMISKKRRGQPDRETETHTYKLNWIPLGSSGPQRGDNILIVNPYYSGVYQDRSESDISIKICIYCYFS